MVRKRDSIKNKVKEVFSPSPTQEPVEHAVDDSLEDDLFAQLDAKEAEQTSNTPSKTPSQTHSMREVEAEAEAEQKKSRKARREEKRLLEEESIRQAAFAEANLPENEKLAKEATEEEKIIIDICNKHARKMHEISPDGHCLYAAIADQVTCDSLLEYSPQFQATYQDMRSTAANYLREHADDFMPFLTTANLTPADGADSDGHEAEGTPMDIAQFNKYCEIVENTGEWGGHIELLAISRAINKPIHVVQRSLHNVILIGGREGEFEHNPEGVDGIWLSFHTRMYGLGEVALQLAEKERRHNVLARSSIARNENDTCIRIVSTVCFASRYFARPLSPPISLAPVLPPSSATNSDEEKYPERAVRISAQTSALRFPGSAWKASRYEGYSHQSPPAARPQEGYRSPDHTMYKRHKASQNHKDNYRWQKDYEDYHRSGRNIDYGKSYGKNHSSYSNRYNGNNMNDQKNLNDYANAMNPNNKYNPSSPRKNQSKNKTKKKKPNNNNSNNIPPQSRNLTPSSHIDRPDFEHRSMQPFDGDPIDRHIDNVMRGAGGGDRRSSYGSFSHSKYSHNGPQPSTSREILHPPTKGTVIEGARNRWVENQLKAQAQTQSETHQQPPSSKPLYPIPPPPLPSKPPPPPKARNLSPKNLPSPKEEDVGPIVLGWHNLPRFDLKEVDESAFQVPDNITDFYDRLCQVGEGTYGKVYKARNKVSKLHVALKRIRMEQERDGFPVTALREIKLLQQSHHDNIVRLHEMLVSNGSVYMVFEYMENDLTGLLQHGPHLFQLQHKKSLCQQMLAGLSYLHYRGILHRDMKGSNILISNKGVLKLADFGLARFFHKHRKADYTNRVITIWYRPPELLLGATSYGPEVDMWSAGCIMLEIYTTKPVFQGDNELHQLEIVFKMLGAPSHQDWPGFSSLPWYELVRPTGKHSSERFRETFKRWLTPAGLELAQALLTFNPQKRLSAKDALQLPFFKSEEPLPELPSHLGELQGEWHEFEAKREKAQARLKAKEMESKEGTEGETARENSA
ncbi:hypothetical protein E3P77_02024 [Wallemia ichthyophaga]|nr:hypothetical protein E3P77_02024 [Wallemia ichthyophaga]